MWNDGRKKARTDFSYPGSHGIYIPMYTICECVSRERLYFTQELRYSQPYSVKCASDIYVVGVYPPPLCLRGVDVPNIKTPSCRWKGVSG